MEKDNVDINPNVGVVKLMSNKPLRLNECFHESNGLIYLTYPPQYKCIKCGGFYRD